MLHVGHKLVVLIGLRSGVRKHILTHFLLVQFVVAAVWMVILGVCGHLLIGTLLVKTYYVALMLMVVLDIQVVVVRLVMKIGQTKINVVDGN